MFRSKSTWWWSYTLAETCNLTPAEYDVVSTERTLICSNISKIRNFSRAIFQFKEMYFTR